NHGIIEIGALLCKPRNPLCRACPLRDDCVAFSTGRTSEFPAPKKKIAMRELRIALYLVTDRRGRVLMRRESGPLMNAMFHLPHGDTSLLTGTPLDVARRERLGAFRHTVTNRRIEFEVFLCHPERSEGPGGTGGAQALPPRSLATLGMTGDYAWIDPADIANIPHPSYVR